MKQHIAEDTRWKREQSDASPSGEVSKFCYILASFTLVINYPSGVISRLL